MVLQLHQQHLLIVCILLLWRFPDQKSSKQQFHIRLQAVTIERFNTNALTINISQTLYVLKTMQVV